MKRYNPSQIEPKWQKVWQDQKTYHANNDSKKPKYYALSMFPYPSGLGLHIGHVRNFTITDAAARFKRMQGYEVLHPMGWDSFGLPGENYAIKTGTPPQVTTKVNTDNFRVQAKHLGLSIDWDREFGSTDPDYYKWTQWFFLLLHSRGLAYQKKSAQFWCDECKTVLANEQVINGCCWRHEDKPVSKKSLKQWFFKITDYAERLETDVAKVDWPESIKTMQRNWIGRSVGAEIDFKVDGHDQTIKVFTTRADTLFGVTFMVLAPEHPLATTLTMPDKKADVDMYIRSAQTQTDIARMDEKRRKTGVFTGSYAINPANGAKVPIWVSDYVLYGYGTGAIMAVPAHDQRDMAFAERFSLPVVNVIDPPADAEQDSQNECYHGEGILINSGKYNGISSSAAREKIVADLVKHGAKERISYKIRDWLISRQRYWGAPIPIVHCAKDGIVPVPADQLPVTLPDLTDFAPSGDGRSPLARATDWVKTTCPTCGGPAERETDTMDGFACSSWYFLRFADPHNNKEPFSKNLADAWLPVDLYVGGAEHAVMHLLYARMWTKVMFDVGLINFDEPFTSLRNQGLLLAADGTKFSKSKGNGVDPEDIINSGYGADALRTVILFLAPFDQYTPWSPESLGGVYRFLNRVWTISQEVFQASGADGRNKEVDVVVNKTIKRVSDDMESMGYNTAIAALMELINELYKLRASAPIDKNAASWHQAVKTIAQLLAPFAPHMAEELWEQCGGKGSVHLSEWPKYDQSLLVQDVANVVVQVNGRVRANLSVAADATEPEVLAAAKSHEHVQKFIGQAQIKRVIYVPGRIINLVV